MKKRELSPFKVRQIVVDLESIDKFNDPVHVRFIEHIHGKSISELETIAETMSQELKKDLDFDYRTPEGIDSLSKVISMSIENNCRERDSSIKKVKTAVKAVILFFASELNKVNNVNLKTNEAIPNDIRDDGWIVLSHYDFEINSDVYTRWVFTKNNRIVSGEGSSDEEALNEIREKIFSDDEE